MESIIKLLIEISVTSAVLIAAVLLIRRAFAKSMSPAVMLVLWGMVLIRLMLPVTFASPLHIGELFPEKQAIQEDATNADAPDTAVSTYAAQDSTSNSVGTYANNDFGETSALETETAAVQPEKSALTLDEILKKIPIWHVLMVVWATGVAAVLAYSLKKAASFGRKLRFCKSVTDKELLWMVTHYKKMAGMRRQITVLECDIVQVPAVFGYINPKILVPSGFLYDIDSKTLRAILLHELLHIRFNDILISYIWLAAKAFHWFNPLVWLAYKRYADDVEIMRDRKAVQSLKEGGALEYSRSLLEAAKHANEKVKAPAAATALFEDKHRLRQRIVCLVKPRKTKKAYAVITTVLALILAVSCFTTACQPTPEEQIIIKKDELEKSIETLPEQDEKFTVPLIWQDEIVQSTTGNNVVIDADVVYPEFDSIDIVGVKPVNFTQEEIDAFIEYFVGDATLYNGEYVETKDVLSSRIIDTQMMMAKTQEERDAYFGGYTLEELQQQLKDLQGRYEAAPETAPKTEATSKLMTVEEKGEEIEILDVYTDNGGDNDTLIEVYNLVGESSNSASFQMRLRDQGAGGTILQYSGTQEEAAQAILNDMGIGNAKLVKTVPVKSSNDSDDAIMLTRLYYEMTYKNVPIRQMSDFIDKDGMQYAAPKWRTDSISLDMSEKGLTGFSWFQHGQIVETVKENVALLPFEEVMQTFEDYIFLQPFWDYADYNGKTEEIKYTIDSIELCMVPVAQKNAQGVFLLVPAWNFYAQRELVIPEEFADYSEEQLTVMGLIEPNVKHSILTISAVDGSLLHG